VEASVSKPKEKPQITSSAFPSCQ